MATRSFIMIPRDVYDDDRVNGRELSVYLAVASHADAAGSAYPAVSTIAKRAGLGQRTVRSALRRLEELGYLASSSWFNESGGQTSNQYTLLHPLHHARSGTQPARRKGSPGATSHLATAPVPDGRGTPRQSSASPSVAAAMDPHVSTDARTRPTKNKPVENYPAAASAGDLANQMVDDIWAPRRHQSAQSRSDVTRALRAALDNGVDHALLRSALDELVAKGAPINGTRLTDQLNRRLKGQLLADRKVDWSKQTGDL